MNVPVVNLRILKSIEEMAGRDWAIVPHAHDAAQQSMKMKAALEMVLAFHSGEPWTPERNVAWGNLQIDAGREFIDDSATTRVLCQTIREVLGLAEEFHQRLVS